MARVRRSRSPRPVSGQKRTRVWAREHAVIALTANTPAVIRPIADFRAELHGGTAGTRGPVGVTIGGGWISQVFDVGTAPIAVARISVGIIVVDEDMTTQVPSPVDDMHVDWMWYQTYYVDTNQTAVHVGDGSQQPLQQWKARRRMDELGMDLFLSVQASVAGAYQVNLSTLLMLP